MWPTQLGDRVLRGAEGKLFQHGLSSLVFYQEQDAENDYPVGVPVFDRLSLPEKLATLEQVAQALLVEDVPNPELTAVTEGTVAAIFAQLVDDIQSEIDEGGSRARKLARSAARASEYDDESIPQRDCTDIDEWEELIELLMDNIFWDRDWQEEFIEPDDPPDLADHVRDRMNITVEYYTAAAPDPPPQRLPQIRESLRSLSRMKLAKSTPS